MEMCGGGLCTWWIAVSHGGDAWMMLWLDAVSCELWLDALSGKPSLVMLCLVSLVS